MNLLTEFKEGLGISWGAIRANKMRSVLTTLGIVIGIVTVTLMGSAIHGLDRAFLKNISFIGADVLYVSRFNWFNDSEEEWRKMQKRRPITPDQARALERQLTLARAVAPEVDIGQSIQYKKRRSDNVRVIGTTDQFVYTSSTGVALGRFLSPLEAEGGRPVCVIGSEVATNLFRARVRRWATASASAASPSRSSGSWRSKALSWACSAWTTRSIIPLKQLMMSFWSNPDCHIQVKVADLGQLEDAKEEVRYAMRTVRRLAPTQPDDFAINQQDQFIKMFHKLGGTIAAVGLFVTGLSLFVGGIGIMNIMFVSVAERTREIGIRKAIGAKRRTILLQFLIEAAGICLIGGGIALGIAWLLTLLVQRFLPVNLSLSIIGLALLVSLLTGVVSGFLPAWRAARMNPVDALRNE